MTIAAILALALVALATGAYAYLVYSPKPQMPSLSSDVQHASNMVAKTFRQCSRPTPLAVLAETRSDRQRLGERSGFSV
jgi:hypothetical protein